MLHPANNPESHLCRASPPGPSNKCNAFEFLSILVAACACVMRAGDAVAARVLWFAAIIGSLSAQTIQDRYLLQMPESIDMTNSSIVRVNPYAGPAVFDQFVVDLWRLGDFELQRVAWSVGMWSGLDVPPDARVAHQLGPTPNQNGSTAVQYFNGSFGANLNLFTNPIQNDTSLGTITIEYNWSPQTRVNPWAAARSCIELSMFYEVPSARREGVAIYTSWTLGLLHDATQKFVWFETALFDLDRLLGGDAVWMDTVSGSAIIHAVLSRETPSLFHTLQPDSCESSTRPFSVLKFFNFTISDDNIHSAMVAANSKFKGLNLSTVASEWQLVHTNVEVEGTGLAACGHCMRDMTIRQVLDGG
jgi:hypothetical protein